MDSQSTSISAQSMSSKKLKMPIFIKSVIKNKFLLLEICNYLTYQEIFSFQLPGEQIIQTIYHSLYCDLKLIFNITNIEIDRLVQYTFNLLYNKYCNPKKFDLNHTFCTIENSIREIIFTNANSKQFRNNKIYSIYYILYDLKAHSLLSRFIKDEIVANPLEHILIDYSKNKHMSLKTLETAINNKKFGMINKIINEIIQNSLKLSKRHTFKKNAHEILHKLLKIYNIELFQLFLSHTVKLKIFRQMLLMPHELRFESLITHNLFVSSILEDINRIEPISWEDLTFSGDDIIFYEEFENNIHFHIAPHIEEYMEEKSILIMNFVDLNIHHFKSLNVIIQYLDHIDPNNFLNWYYYNNKYMLTELLNITNINSYMIIYLLAKYTKLVNINTLYGTGDIFNIINKTLINKFNLLFSHPEYRNYKIYYINLLMIYKLIEKIKFTLI